MTLVGQVEKQLRRAHYSAASAAKVSWYSAFYVMGRHIVGPLTKPGEVPRPARSEAPGLGAMRAAFAQLFADERGDIDRGLYRMPREFRTPVNPVTAIKDARSYLREARAVTRRANQPGGGTEVRASAPKGLPTYYLQNFHFQSDGWLSDASAKVYDTQVEVLFTGAAGAMRRRALSLIAEEVARLTSAGRSPASISVADVGCGTGPLLADIADNFPQLQLTALDLSEPYLRKAKAALPAGARANFLHAAAEKLPFADGSLDILTTVYLFHELPPKVRSAVAAEIARVLKPGGLYVHLDSVQYGDTAMDLLLETFPRAFHEPYYESYCQLDLAQLFGAHGLAPDSVKTGFLSKAAGFRKPAH